MPSSRDAAAATRRPWRSRSTAVRPMPAERQPQRRGHAARLGHGEQDRPVRTGRRRRYRHDLGRGRLRNGDGARGAELPVLRRAGIRARRVHRPEQRRPGDPGRVHHRPQGRGVRVQRPHDRGLAAEVHCIYALGFQTYSTRVLIHSALGCFFYGAFVAKMLSLTWRESMPRWAVPILGGTVFLGLIGVWLTSFLWLFTSQGWHF